MSIERPIKRTRVLDTADLHVLSPKVKDERSPSPLLIARRLVTCGTKRYNPIPTDCLSSCPEYKRNRSEWVARCVKELEALNLIAERKLVRDDGLIIDWRSHIPVWSDTLRPNQLDLPATITLVHRSNAQLPRPLIPIQSSQRFVPTATREGTLPGVQSPLKKRLPAPLRPSLKHQSKSIFIHSSPGSPGSQGPRSPDEIEHGSASTPSYDCISSSVVNRTPSDISNQLGQVGFPLKLSNRTYDPSITPCTSSAEEVMSKMTLNYLRRYIQTYEADRASLASAYARHASFAYRVHRAVQNTSSTLPIRTECFSSGIKRTRLDIATTLLTLPCLHSNAKSLGTAQAKYDMFYLGAELGMFVVCRVVSSKTVAHNFILQRKGVDVEDAIIEGVWALAAIAHQILVFET